MIPRISADREKGPLSDRIRNAILKPVEPDVTSASRASGPAPSVEEMESAVRFADDKERLVGLLAAPVAAAIGFLVISALIANDPPPYLKNGQVNKLHVSVSLYHNLTGVLLGLSVLMLVMAMLRKRLYLGIVMALYGLTVFNLHYWGFGVPFLMAGSWLLVRSYRVQRDLREASGEGARSGGSHGRRSASGRSRPKPSRRYTPPIQRSRQPSPSKIAKQPRAG